jgi:ferrous iron transport protein B
MQPTSQSNAQPQVDSSLQAGTRPDLETRSHATAKPATPPVIALAGSPNAGKSVLFNSLTKLNQKVANYAGVTVEKKSGLSPVWNNRQFIFTDLPGTYSLEPVSLDEQIAVDLLLGRGIAKASDRPNLVIAVLDASNLERTLGLALELKATGLPMIVVLNMMDMAKRRGIKINTNIISRELGCPVIPMVAIKGDGVSALMARVDQMLPRDKPPASPPASEWSRATTEDVVARFARIDSILAAAIETAGSSDRVSWKIDRVVLHPVLGSVILLAVLLTLFQTVFTWASPLADQIEALVVFSQNVTKSTLPSSMLRDLLTEGVLGGVGSVLVFLPQIMMLFLFINILEGSGYMARAAFMLDRMMFSVGLQGRSFVPLLSSFACAIPGIMATRTIRDDRDRLTTIMVAPLITCSARLPVYTLLISAFVPPVAGAFGISLQAWVMLALFVVGVLSVFAAASVTCLLSRGRGQSPFMLELPAYRWPHWRYVATSLWQRVLAFLRRAGTIILGLSVVLWVLSTYPRPPEGATDPAINYSAAARIGHFLEPLVRPVGFDWRIATGLVPGFAAREVMVSSLATVFAVEQSGDDDQTTKSLSGKLQTTWAPASGFSLLAWYVFAPQCLATIATVRRETGGWKWALVMLVYMFTLAWIAAFVTFRIFS